MNATVRASHAGIIERAPARRGPNPVSFAGEGIRIEVSLGELLDRISILRIKSERITRPAGRRRVTLELAALEEARAAAIDEPSLDEIERKLRSVNEALWRAEDAVRGFECAQDFGPRFVETARSVYRLNDLRAALKRDANEISNSRLVEEKQYAAYP